MTGYAALITIDFENENVMWSIFREEDGARDPILRAQALGRSVESDWPTHEQHVVANERARELQAMRLLGPLYGPSVAASKSPVVMLTASDG